MGEQETRLFELPPKVLVPQLPNPLSMDLLQWSENTRRSCLSCRPSCWPCSCLVPYLWIYCRGRRARDAAVWAAARSVGPAAAQCLIYESIAEVGEHETQFELPPELSAPHCLKPYLWIYCRGRRARDAAVWAAARAVYFAAAQYIYLWIYCRGWRARDAAVWAAARAVGPAEDALRERPRVVCAGGRRALPLGVRERDQRHQVGVHKEYFGFSWGCLFFTQYLYPVNHSVSSVAKGT